MSASTEFFLVDYLDDRGAKKTLHIEARSAEEARQSSGVPRARIQSARKDFIGKIRHAIKRDVEAPSMDIQANILNVLSVMIQSGRPPAQSVDQIASGYKKFASKMSRIRREDLVSKKFEVMMMEREIIRFAKNGEKSGTLGDVLSGAADDLIEKRRMRSQMMTMLLPPMGIAIFAVLVLAVVPMFVIKDMGDIMNTKGFVVPTNVATDITMWIGHFVPKWWTVMVGALVAAALTRPKWWPVVRPWPGFGDVQEFFLVQNAYKFITGFLPLFARGIPIMEAVDTMSDGATGEEAAALGRIKEALKRGRGFGASFDGDAFWHQSLRDIMRAFDEVRESAKPEMLKRLKPSLMEMTQRAGMKLAVYMSGVGLIAIVTIALLLALGLLFPMMGVTTARPGSGV